MKKITLLLLGLLVMTSVSADENNYVPLVREGVVWEYVRFNSYIWLNPNSEETFLYSFEFKGTTDIVGEDGLSTTYYNLYRTNYDKEGNAQEPYLAALAKEEGKIVTAIDKNYGFTYSVPDTVYDFNKPMFLPDMAIEQYDNCCPLPYDLDRCELIEVEIAGTIRKGYHICTDYPYDSDHIIDDFKTIEGVGVACLFGDLLMPYRPFVTKAPVLSEVDYGDDMAGLSAIYENGELVYKGVLYDFAQQLKDPDAITTVQGNKQIANVCYYNLAGVESAEPQQGVNIKVTTYTDGTRSSEKVLK